MPNQIWTIHAGGQGGGANSSDLVGCHLVAVYQDGSVQYQFEKPDGSWVQSSAINPTPPFQFPVFNSALGGRPGSPSVDWYITVCSLTGGNSNNQASGTWSNSAYQSCPGATISADPSDTWVAQSGATAEEEDAAGAGA